MADSKPLRRSNSPACGVRTRRWGEKILSIISARRASASMIAGPFHKFKVSRIKEWVSASTPNPGPAANAVDFPKIDELCQGLQVQDSRLEFPERNPHCLWSLSNKGCM